MGYISRRRFVASSAATLAAPLIVPAATLGSSAAPSNQITVGCIGTGSHGIARNLKMYLKQKDARVLAVCDVDAGHMQAAKQLVDQQYGNRDCSTTTDFRDILERPDIDAVMISTPDHWHTLMSVLAIRAGKDVQ